MELNLYNSLKKSEDLMELLKESDISTLTLVLSHLTSDLSYVDKIRPFVKGAFDYSVNVPDDISYMIRKKLIEVLLNISNKNNSLNFKNNIKDEYLSIIMSVGVGTDVPKEYVSMMKEELDINNSSTRDIFIENIKKHKSKHNAIIIGSGISGLTSGVLLLIFLEMIGEKFI